MDDGREKSLQSSDLAAHGARPATDVAFKSHAPVMRQAMISVGSERLGGFKVRDKVGRFSHYRLQQVCDFAA
jgi:hypothetical protein